MVAKVQEFFHIRGQSIDPLTGLNDTHIIFQLIEMLLFHGSSMGFSEVLPIHQLRKEGVFGGYFSYPPVATLLSRLGCVCLSFFNICTYTILQTLINSSWFLLLSSPPLLTDLYTNLQKKKILSPSLSFVTITITYKTPKRVITYHSLTKPSIHISAPLAITILTYPVYLACLRYIATLCLIFSLVLLTLCLIFSPLLIIVLLLSDITSEISLLHSTDLCTSISSILNNTHSDVTLLYKSKIRNLKTLSINITRQKLALANSSTYNPSIKQYFDDDSSTPTIYHCGGDAFSFTMHERERALSGSNNEELAQVLNLVPPGSEKEESFQEEENSEKSVPPSNYDADFSDSDYESAYKCTNDPQFQKSPSIHYLQGPQCFNYWKDYKLDTDDLYVFECTKDGVYAAYKPVDRRVKPVSGTFPEDARVERRFPCNPLDTLPPLSPIPPDFIPTERLTQERLDSLNLNPDNFLSSEEVKLFTHILHLNHLTLAFEEGHRGTFRQDYFTPYIIPVVEHEPWEFKNIPIPPGIKEKVIDLLKDMIAAGVYEPSQSSYRSRWFCVMKKNGNLRLVHDLQPLNKITIRDASLPPRLDDFVEPFAAHSCYSVFDMFWGFHARKLDFKSRDLTSFQTPLGLLRITSLPMGFTNSPAEFQKCMVFILQDEIPAVANVFIDDLPIKGPADDYLDEEGNPEVLKENPGIRR